jgi:hypothetical protein
MDELGTEVMPVEIQAWASLASALLVEGAPAQDSSSASSSSSSSASSASSLSTTPEASPFASREVALDRVRAVGERVLGSLGLGEGTTRARAGGDAASAASAVWTAKGKVQFVWGDEEPQQRQQQAVEAQGA